MSDVGEAVLSGYLVGPPLHGGPGRLHRASALTADQMVMMLTLATPAEQLLAAGQPGGVHLAGLDQQLQRAVHGGEADARVAGEQHLVQVLRRMEPLGLPQQGQRLATLAGVAVPFGLPGSPGCVLLCWRP